MWIKHLQYLLQMLRWKLQQQRMPKRIAAKAPTMPEVDRVRALLEDVDLDEWYYAVEDEQLSSVNSEATASHDLQNMQTDNRFVTEQTDPDPNRESWHPDRGRHHHRNNGI